MINKGRNILTDAQAEGSDPNTPAFLSKPEAAPVYYGFPIIEESETDGWRLGAITEFIDAEEGDAFVVAPDGSRAGLVWEVGDGEFATICEPDADRWGVYAVWFPEQVKSVADFVFNFRHVLPLLSEKFNQIRFEGK